MAAIRCSWCDSDSWDEHIDKKTGDITHTCKHCKKPSDKLSPRYIPHEEKCVCPVHST